MKCFMSTEVEFGQSMTCGENVQSVYWTVASDKQWYKY